MAGSNNSALEIARAYFNAMASKDVDGIISLVAPNVTVASPLGTLGGADAFRGFQEGFAHMIDKLTLVVALGEGEDAVVLYVANTKPVAEAYVAEQLTVRDGKIVALRVIYDSAPFAEYVASVQPH